MDKLCKLDTVALDDENSAIVIIDQTLLPSRAETISLTTPEQLWEAIKALRVRGAPAIGVAAAFGMYLAAKRSGAQSGGAIAAELEEMKSYLDSSRPTAVNLPWATARMLRVCRENAELLPKKLKERLHDEALMIQQEDIDTCRTIGEYALTLVKEGDGLLTHCNAGRLATSRYGTATAVMYLGAERGYGFRIYADETRPLLQGARLTASELHEAGLDVTLICDGMCASVMRQGLVDAVFVGCDRVAANGDAANKIGTSTVAAAAKYYGIPFYVCAPTSTVDMNTPDGDHIEIEQRDASEVTDLWYSARMAPDGVKVLNPAFDVTNADLITAIITERGILYPPFDKALADIM